MNIINVDDLATINDGFEETTIIKYRGLEVEIKKYLPILEKVNLVSSIVKGCIRDNGVEFEIDHASKNVAYGLEIINSYTNIDVPNNSIEVFDTVKKSGLLDVVIGNIPHAEIVELYNMLENKLQEKRNIHQQKNKLENIVKSGIDRLILLMESFIGEDSAMDLIELSQKAVNELNPDNLEFVKEFLKANKGVN